MSSHPSQHHDHILKGILFAACAFFLMAVMNAMAKMLSGTYHIVEIAFFRNVFATLPFLIYILSTRQFTLFKTKKPRVLAFRCTLGAISLMTTFAAFKVLPMAEATVLLFASSLMIPALSFFILKEHVGPYRWGAILFGFSGILIMAGIGGFSSWIGVVIGLSAASMHAILQIALRYLKTESPITVTFYFVFVGIFVTGLFLPFFATWDYTPKIWGLFALIGLTGALAQLCLSNAFKNAPASVVSSFNYTGLIWATGFDLLIWNFIPGWPVFAGGSIVIASALFITYREHKRAKTAQRTSS
jgi:drug/metabolite transporter (DMT)-like permease